MLQKTVLPIPWFHMFFKELKDLSHRETERGCYSQPIDEKPRAECHIEVTFSNEVNPILIFRLNCCS